MTQPGIELQSPRLLANTNYYANGQYYLIHIRKDKGVHTFSKRKHDSAIRVWTHLLQYYRPEL